MRTDSFQKSRTTRFRKIRIIRWFKNKGVLQWDFEKRTWLSILEKLKVSTSCNKFIQIFLSFKYHIRVPFVISIIFYTAKVTVFGVISTVPFMYFVLQLPFTTLCGRLKAPLPTLISWFLIWSKVLYVKYSPFRI